MSDDEAIDLMTDGWNLVFQQGAILALLPIEEWVMAFDHADSVGHVLDPTLYREAIYSGKPKLIREVLEGALVFKKAILKAQKQVEGNPRLR